MGETMFNKQTVRDIWNALLEAVVATLLTATILWAINGFDTSTDPPFGFFLVLFIAYFAYLYAFSKLRIFRKY
jgi:hypothetical protein